MPNFSAIRGLHNLKSVASVRKEGDSDTALLKLYMLEKERIRIVNDKKRAELKLEFINNRLKEIDEAFIDTLRRKIEAGYEQDQK